MPLVIFGLFLLVYTAANAKLAAMLERLAFSLEWLTLFGERETGEGEREKLSLLNA